MKKQAGQKQAKNKNTQEKPPPSSQAAVNSLSKQLQDIDAKSNNVNSKRSRRATNQEIARQSQNQQGRAKPEVNGVAQAAQGKSSKKPKQGQSQGQGNEAKEKCDPAPNPEDEPEIQDNAQLLQQQQMALESQRLLEMVNMGAVGGGASGVPGALGGMLQQQMMQRQMAAGGDSGGEGANEWQAAMEAQAQQVAAMQMGMNGGGLQNGVDPDAASQLAQGFGGFMPFAFDASMLNGGDDNDEEEYVSDEEFQKGLSDQERRIFNALVIAINQTHMIRQKDFQKRRMEYLQTENYGDQFIAQAAQDHASMQARAMSSY